MAAPDPTTTGFRTHVVAAVQAPAGSRKIRDLAVEGRTVSVDDGSSRKSFEVDCLLGPSTAPSDVMEETLDGPLGGVLMGTSGAVVVLGSIVANRNDLYQGDGVTPGVVQHAISRLYADLERTAKQAADSAPPDLGKPAFQYSISATAVEIAGEGIRDLLASVPGSDLMIREHDVEGVGPVGATVVGPVPTEDAMIDTFNSAVDARTTAGTEHGPATMYSHMVFRLQVDTTNNLGVPDFRRCTLTLAEIAGVEKLAEDAAAVKAREGPVMNHAIHNFASVAASIRGAQGEILAPFKDSKLTHMLMDCLGGNCFTVALVPIQHGEPRVSQAALSVASNLRRITAYPIVNTATARGLLRSYRVKIRLLKEELADAHAGKKGSETKAKEEAVADALRVSELEQQHIKDKFDKLKLKEEIGTLTTQLKEFRSKFAELTKTLADAQEELIVSEEEKLKVSKALLDLRIENTELKDSIDKGQYDLSAKLLSAEEEKLEAETKLEMLTSREKELSEEVQKLMDERKSLVVELTTLKANLVARTKEVGDNRGRVTDIGAELLTMRNRVEFYEKQAAETDGKIREAEQAAMHASEEASRLQEENDILSAKLRDALSNLTQAQSEKLHSDFAAEQAALEAERARRKPPTARAPTERTERSEKARKAAAADGSPQPTARTKALGMVHRSREMAELRDELEATKDEVDAALARAKRAEAALDGSANDFRERVMVHLTRDMADEAARVAAAADVVGSYQKQLRSSHEEIDALRGNIRALWDWRKIALRRFRVLRYRVADLTKDAAEKDDMEKGAGSASLSDIAISDDATGEMKEIERLRDALTAEQLRVIKTAEDGIAKARSADSMVTALRAEVATLSEALDNVKSERDSIAKAEHETSEELRLQTLARSEAQRALEELAQMKQRFGDVQREAEGLKAENTELREHLEKVSSNTADVGRVAALAAEVARLQSENRKLASTKSEADAKQLRSLQEENGAVRRKLMDARNQLQMMKVKLQTRDMAATTATAGSTGGVDEESLMGQLMASESKAVGLMTKNATLQAELESYQRYMRETITKYQREVARLNKEVHGWRARAGGPTVPR